MKTLRCKCAGCGAELAQLVNLWTQIGKTYYSPILDPEHGMNIITLGQSRIGDEMTLVADCELQDIACAKCRAVVGLKCLKTPVNHVLDDDQVLFRLTAMVATDLLSGTKVDLVVKRLLKLKDGHRTSSGSTDPQPGLIDVSRIEADLLLQQEEIERIDTAGFRIVQSFDSAVSRIESEVRKLNENLLELRKDLDGNRDDVASLKTGLTEVKKAAQDKTASAKLGHVESSIRQISTTIGTTSEQLKRDLKADVDRFRAEAKAEVNTAKGDAANAKKLAKDTLVVAKEYSREVASLRQELKQVRQEMEQERAKPAEPTQPAAFPSRELDILTSNIATIRNRISEVEPMHMDFQLFKMRVERLEAAAAAAATTATENAKNGQASRRESDDMDLLPTEQRPPKPRSDPRRKRPSTSRDVSQAAGAPAKRAAYTPDDLDGPGSGYDTEPGWPRASSPLSPASLRDRPDGKLEEARRTKTGAVDKRFLKRGPRRSLRAGEVERNSNE